MKRTFGGVPFTCRIDPWEEPWFRVRFPCNQSIEGKTWWDLGGLKFIPCLEIRDVGWNMSKSTFWVDWYSPFPWTTLRSCFLVMGCMGNCGIRIWDVTSWENIYSGSFPSGSLWNLGSTGLPEKHPHFLAIWWRWSSSGMGGIPTPRFFFFQTETPQAHQAPWSVTQMPWWGKDPSASVRAAAIPLISSMGQVHWGWYEMWGPRVQQIN